MTKVKKPTTVAEWEKVCNNLNAALKQSIATEDRLKEEIEDLEQQLETWDEEIDGKVEQLEEQLTMSVGVIKYLEMKLEKSNQLKISGGKN
jgi:DNA-binding transcriptional regulator GbsR (MarR family)